MIRRILAWIASVAIVFGVVAQSVSAFAQTTTKTPVLSQIRIIPATGKIALGSPLQLKVIAFYKNYTSQYVTNSTGIVYISSNPSVATVSTTGLVTVQGGTRGNEQVSVTASYGGMSTKATFTIVSALNFVVTPETIDLKPGDSYQLKAYYPLNDGTQTDVTKAPGTTYVSSNTKIATVSTTGLVTVPENVILADQSNHLANITVTNKGISRTVMVRAVIKDYTVIDKLTITPKTDTMQPGTSQQLKVEYILSDGTTRKNVTTASGTVYTSSNPAVATVSPTGVVTVSSSISENTSATITATNTTAGVTLSTTLIIKVWITKPVRIMVEPKSIQLYPGESKQIKVYEVYSDGKKVDVTNAIDSTSFSSTSTPLVYTSGMVTLGTSYTGRPTNVKLNIKKGSFTTSLVVLAKPMKK